VYDRLAACAESILAGGYAALIDATFARREDRSHFIALAARLGVPLGIIHCRAEPPVLRARIARRRRLATDVSEADECVLEWQLNHFEPIAADEGAVIIDADTGRGEVVSWVLNEVSGIMSGA
jgi:predicted kinase